MNIKKMTGLELYQAIAGEELPPPSMATIIPIKITQVEEGKVVCSATANDSHLNPVGGVHGGFAATVLDSVTAIAVHSLLGPGVECGTIDLCIKMIKPTPKDEELIAEGKVINISKLLGISEGTLKSQDGKLLATATATCMILES